MDGYHDRLTGEWVTVNLNKCNRCGRVVAFKNGGTGGISGACLELGCPGEFRRVRSPIGTVAVASEERT